MITDYKPLLSIVKKDIINVPPRLARLLLRVHISSLTLHFRPGKQMHWSNVLSQSEYELNADPENTELKLDIHSLSQEVNTTVTHLQYIQDTTEKDSTLKDLIKFVLLGWLEQKSEVPEHIAPYLNFDNEIGIVDGVLIEGNRIIIPDTLRKEVLRQLYLGQLGMDKCQFPAHGSVY